MRKLVAAALLSLASIAHAAGVYDGIYQHSSGAYYSVHQNGNTLLVVSMASIAANGTGFTLPGGYIVRPPTIEAWNYSMGTISGAVARVTGTGPFGTCTTTSDAQFDGAGTVYVTFVSTTNSALANAQGINCQTVLATTLGITGYTLTLRRIF